MTISFYCKCGRRITVDDQHGGKTGRCANCGNVLQIPLAVETDLHASRKPCGVFWVSSWMSSFLVHVLLLIVMTFILFQPLVADQYEAIWCRTDTVEGLLDDLTINQPELFDKAQFFVEHRPPIRVASVVEDVTPIDLDGSKNKANNVTPRQEEQVALFDTAPSDAPTDDRKLKEIDRRISRAGGEIGEITVSLVWHSLNDVDLHVVNPKGEEIYFDHVTGKYGGTLDVDKNVTPETKFPVENIRWIRNAPLGRYRVIVVLYRTHEAIGDDEFLVRVKGGDVQKLLHGHVSPSESEVHVLDFSWNGAEMTVAQVKQK